MYATQLLVRSRGLQFWSLRLSWGLASHVCPGDGTAIDGMADSHALQGKARQHTKAGTFHDGLCLACIYTYLLDGMDMHLLMCSSSNAYAL